MQFIVITSVPPPGDQGNLALVLDVFFEPPATPQNFDNPLPRLVDYVGQPMLALALRAPVFTLGEVLICDFDGRELVGAGRKPSKWSVGAETFQTPEEAVKRAREVQVP